jgi:hypothetical protein
MMQDTAEIEDRGIYSNNDIADSSTLSDSVTVLLGFDTFIPLISH